MTLRQEASREVTYPRRIVYIMLLLLLLLYPLQVLLLII